MTHHRLLAAWSLPSSACWRRSWPPGPSCLPSPALCRWGPSMRPPFRCSICGACGGTRIACRTAFTGLWNAPIFHPLEGTFTFSEPMLLQGVTLSPLWWMGAPPAAIYNLAILLTLVCNGLATRSLARALGAPRRRGPPRGARRRHPSLYRQGPGSAPRAPPLRHDLGARSPGPLREGGRVATRRAGGPVIRRAVPRRGADGAPEPPFSSPGRARGAGGAEVPRPVDRDARRSGDPRSPRSLAHRPHGQLLS